MVGGAKKPVAIIVLDGWGIAPAWGGNAISQARTKNFTTAFLKYPSTSLLASGESVGLPPKSPGNSEAGHLNIGSGRIIHQDITLIDQRIQSKDLNKNIVLEEAVIHSKKFNSKIHVMGLLSKTGTHSHVRHLYSLLEILKEKNVSSVSIHLFSDGRDSDPMSGIEMVNEVGKKIQEIGLGEIATISGRFFSMDRDNRWGRIARAYNLLVKGEGNIYESSMAAFSSAYSSGQTDEFIEPRAIINKTQPRSIVENNDAVIFFNFRSDRAKELTSAFLDSRVPGFPDRKILKNLYFATYVIYDENPKVHRIFTPEKVQNPIAKVWSTQKLKQLHIAETEKYAHVTYFFNGGKESLFPGESRQIIQSNRSIKTYDLMPRMCAATITNYVIRALKKNDFDRYVINFANTDMVGHTGNLSAVIQAAESVDDCLGQVLDAIIQQNGIAFICSDHGNAEQMVNPITGDPDTEHTTNPVPFIIVSNDQELKSLKLRSDGILGDISPTLLGLTGSSIPAEMTGQSLIINEAAL